MFTHELRLPSMPSGAVREPNREMLNRLGHDLTLIDNQQLSAVDSYQMFGYDEFDHPFWRYCVESAGISVTNEILVLICSDVEGDNENTRSEAGPTVLSSAIGGALFGGGYVRDSAGVL